MKTRLGHVHLKVTDIERSKRFYTELLGLRESEEIGPFRFLSAGEAHHDVALQQSGAPGLYHVAFEVPDAESLDAFEKRLEGAMIPCTRVDHGISEAVYFRDPDGIGVEVYLDRRAAPGGRRTWSGATRPVASSA